MFHQQRQILLKDNLILLETCVGYACHVSMTFLTEKSFIKVSPNNNNNNNKQFISFKLSFMTFYEAFKRSSMSEPFLS